MSMDLLDLVVSIERDGGGRGDRTARVYRALRSAIADGRLQPGDRLPPSRSLAAELGLSRNTVAAAYDRLTAEGFVAGRAGAGTFVTDTADVQPPRRRTRRTPGVLTPRRGWSAEPQTSSSSAAPPLFDFRVGIPDAGLFPFDRWRRYLTDQARAGAGRPGSYAEPGGHPELREQIVRFLAAGRSVRADPDDVLVTSGAQQAVDLIGRVLVAPGDVVAVEEPGYPPVRALFASLGARVVGVPVDRDGLVVDALPTQAKVVYSTPSHQFPLGTPMSLSRRTALLAWAQRRDAAVIEDDYDSEFRFSDRPLEPLHVLDGAGRVLYVGTFSKTLLPTLRLGFVVAPPSLRSALRAAKQLSVSHTPVATEAALARFMADGLLARHLRLASRVYRRRHAEVVGYLEQDLAAPSDPTAPLELLTSVAGLHVSARLRSGDAAQADAVVAGARERSVGVDALSQYCAGAPQAGFVFGYGALRDGTAREGLTRFQLVLDRSSRRR
ncbi:MAG: PLP-dependent aminotransferase family protein [Actinomycetales bacterium]